MAYGRPMKGRTRRTPITIHAPIGTIALIDEFVADRAAELGKVYSRSDFYNEAAIALLKRYGIPVEDEPERTFSVPKKISLENQNVESSETADEAT